jgi:hypothetical protein
MGIIRLRRAVELCAAACFIVIALMVSPVRAEDWRIEIEPLDSPFAITTGASALQVAQAMAANPDIITGASYVTRPPSNLTVGLSDTVFPGFPISGGTYGIMSTGSASFGSTTSNMGGGNVRGDTDRDVTIMRIDLVVPNGANCLGFEFRFLSVEWPDYVGTQYNDAFIAEMNNSTWTTNGSTITAPNNFAFDPNGNVMSINATGPALMNASNASGTPFLFYGASPIVQARAQVTPGSQSLYLSIFDQGDALLDSAVFIDNLAVGNAASGTCTTGLTAPGQIIFLSGCNIPIPANSVVGAAPNGAVIYWEPGQSTSPTLRLNPGTYWVLGQDSSQTYYKIILACQYRWVLKSEMGPNNDQVWRGRALPTDIVS